MKKLLSSLVFAAIAAVSLSAYASKTTNDVKVERIYVSEARGYHRLVAVLNKSASHCPRDKEVAIVTTDATLFETFYETLLTAKLSGRGVQINTSESGCSTGLGVFAEYGSLRFVTLE